MYLERFTFPDADMENDFMLSIKRTCHNSFYPFGVLTRHRLEQLDFEPLTILCGGNGCGKTTALNVIAEKLSLPRETPFNKSEFFSEYVRHCTSRTAEIPEYSAVITSDDVFDFMLSVRCMNEGIDHRRQELFGEYLDAKYSDFKVHSLDDFDRLKKVVSARSKTQSKFVRENLINNVREQSNGESGYYFFTEKLKDNGLYLLDEPENSLSAAMQQELADFLQNSVRFFGCQLIISTHSPFLLAMRDAKIYNFDADPVDVMPWTDIESVRSYYDFFKRHKKEFEE